MSLLLALACLAEPTESPATSASSPDQLNQSTLKSVDPTPREIPGLISALASEETSAVALTALVEIGEPAVPMLEIEALRGKDITARGWSVQALSRIDADSAETSLQTIRDTTDNALVRTWASAGLLQQADDIDELMARSSLQWENPALQRTFSLRARELGSMVGELRAAIVLISQDASMGAVVGPVLADASVEDLAQLMFNDPDNGVRWTSAGLLAGRPNEAQKIARQYAFTPGAEEVLWAGGALYVPNVGWGKKDAKVLVGNLVAWFVFCEEKGLEGEKQQIYNNLNSLGLINTIGMAWPGFDGHELLVQYGQATSVESARRILAEQGLLDHDDWAAALARI